MSPENTRPAAISTDEGSPEIPEAQLPQWRADVAALHDLHVAHEQAHLRMGDLYNELKARWDVKMPALAKEAGVPYHAARQRAHIASLAPTGSKLRATGLGYSIIRLLAPLPDPEPWAQLALTQQSQGQLRVRAFAQTLVDAGLRRPRRTRVYSPPCLHCDAMWGDHHTGVHIRGEKESGYLCSPRCAAAYFADIQARAERKALLLSRFAGATRESQSPAAAPDPESKVQNPKSDAAPTRHESQPVPPSLIQNPPSEAAQSRHESQSDPPSLIQNPKSKTQIPNRRPKTGSPECIFPQVGPLWPNRDKVLQVESVVPCRGSGSPPQEAAPRGEPSRARTRKEASHGRQQSRPRSR